MKKWPITAYPTPTSLPLVKGWRALLVMVCDRVKHRAQLRSAHFRADAGRCQSHGRSFCQRPGKRTFHWHWHCTDHNREQRGINNLAILPYDGRLRMLPNTCNSSTWKVTVNRPLPIITPLTIQPGRSSGVGSALMDSTHSSSTCIRATMTLPLTLCWCLNATRLLLTVPLPLSWPNSNNCRWRTV